MNPAYHVQVKRFRDPIGPVTHAILKCPRCERNIGVTKAMLLGIDSIICKGALGRTNTICNGHFYFDKELTTLRFVGTVNE